MNSRRKFLIQGSLATTALLVAKPFKTLAGAASPVTGFNTNNNKVIFLHTGNFRNINQQQVISHIADLKNTTGNIVLLHAGDDVSNNSVKLNYDASISQNNSISASANNYRIIYKGKIKIGVISAMAGESNLVSNINKLSSWLKKERNCHIVVCLSQLGYKNKKAVDDITLAAASTSLDMIIGGNAKNFTPHPSIVLNSDKAEVIINHAANSALALGKIEIAFDDQGKKRNVAFNEGLDQGRRKRIA